MRTDPDLSNPELTVTFAPDSFHDQNLFDQNQTHVSTYPYRAPRGAAAIGLVVTCTLITLFLVAAHAPTRPFRLNGFLVYPSPVTTTIFWVCVAAIVFLCLAAAYVFARTLTIRGHIVLESKIVALPVRLHQNEIKKIPYQSIVAMHMRQHRPRALILRTQEEVICIEECILKHKHELELLEMELNVRTRLARHQPSYDIRSGF